MNWEAHDRLLEQLVKDHGSADAYLTLRTIDEDLANRIDEAREAEYDAAPEEDHSNIDFGEKMFNPDYKMSKAEVIVAWAGDVIRSLRNAYLEKIGEEGLKALSRLASLDGTISPVMRIAQGVEISMDYTRKDFCNYLP